MKDWDARADLLIPCCTNRPRILKKPPRFAPSPTATTVSITQGRDGIRARATDRPTEQSSRRQWRSPKLRWRKLLRNNFAAPGQLFFRRRFQRLYFLLTVQKTFAACDPGRGGLVLQVVSKPCEDAALVI